MKILRTLALLLALLVVTPINASTESIKIGKFVKAERHVTLLGQKERLLKKKKKKKKSTKAPKKKKSTKAPKKDKSTKAPKKKKNTKAPKSPNTKSTMTYGTTPVKSDSIGSIGSSGAHNDIISSSMQLVVLATFLVSICF